MSYRILGCIVVFCVLSFTAFAQNATIISGEVLRGNLPQPKVKVTLTPKNPKVVQKKEVETKDDGTFEFVGVAPGDYELVAERRETIAKLPLNVPKNKAKIEGLKLMLRIK